MINNDDLEIINQYNAEIRGLYNYCKIENNVSVLGDFYYVMKYSMFKTFAAKYKTHISVIRKKYGYKRFGVKYDTKDKKKVAYFYDEGFRYGEICTRGPEIDIIPQLLRNLNITSLLARLNSNICEWWCGKCSA